MSSSWTLHDEQIEAFRKWLSEKNVPTKCNTCNQSHRWEVGWKFVIQPPYGGLVAGQIGNLLSLYLVCQNCGHIRLFDATVVGILPPPFPPDANATIPKKILW